MKCFFCSEEIADNTLVCPWCGRRQEGVLEKKLAPHPTNIENYNAKEGSSLSEDTGWKCKNCSNFNVRTNICRNCGKDKSFIPVQDHPTDTDVSKKSKADEYYEKGMKNFFEIFGESDKGKVSGHLNKAQGYLTMAYKAAGNDVEEKKGIAGLMALILTNMDDYKNAETWARAEFTINPMNVFAKLAWYYIELNKLVGHKGFVTKGGSGAGIVLDLVTLGVDIGRIGSKKSAVKTAALEAAKAIEGTTKTEKDPNPGLWILWSMMLLSIIDNMWANDMREPYLCNVLLNLPWSRFPEEDIKDMQESIEEIQVESNGYLGRLK